MLPLSLPLKMVVHFLVPISAVSLCVYACVCVCVCLEFQQNRSKQVNPRSKGVGAGPRVLMCRDLHYQGCNKIDNIVVPFQMCIAGALGIPGTRKERSTSRDVFVSS